MCLIEIYKKKVVLYELPVRLVHLIIESRQCFVEYKYKFLKVAMVVNPPAFTLLFLSWLSLNRMVDIKVVIQTKYAHLCIFQFTQSQFLIMFR